MHIRRLNPIDAPEYRAFRLRGLREHPEAFTSSFEEASLRPLADLEKRLAAPSEKVWGAYVDGTLAGMVGLAHETRLKNRHKAALVGMFVAGEFAGRGLGRALVDAVLREARGCGVGLVVLTVTEGNLPAIALYERAGFASFGIEPDAIRVAGVSLGKQHMFFQLGAS
ncbi:MAG: GCN5-related N-acetyltransferase [Polaromonas sp.]|nr:GCN5-related N-acetyltransferase [Polaromonas sp.]